MIELTTLHPHGVFLRRHAVDFGYRDRDLTQAQRAKVIHRVRHGAYVDAQAWASADPQDRHRMVTHAALLTHRPGSVVLSHTSAAVMHGLALHRPDLRRVHLTVVDGTASRTTADLAYHQGSVMDSDVVHREGAAVIEPVRASLEAAALADTESAVVVLDSALSQRHADHASLWTTYERMKRWPGTLRLQVAVRLARPGAQSVGESRTRYLCWRARVPEPVLQHEVVDGSGNVVGVSDFWWPDRRLLGEFDGAVKYGRYLRPGELPGDAVFREKRREDKMRELTGGSMIRFVWADLAAQHSTVRRLRLALGMEAA